MERMLINERDIQENEPGVLKYAACVPREDDGKTLWIIEEYGPFFGNITKYSR